MKVKELIDALEKCDDNIDVKIVGLETLYDIDSVFLLKQIKQDNEQDNKSMVQLVIKE